MTAYIILGSHRSGTSLVANLLNSAGISMHETTRLPDKWNAGGYGEDEAFKAISKAILQEAGGWWAMPPKQEHIEDAAREYGMRIRLMAAARELMHPKWGLKDPRLCLTIPYYPIDAQYIFVKRGRESIIDSLMRRELEKERLIKPYSFWYDLVSRYVDTAYAFLVDKSYITVRYEALMSKKSVDLELALLKAFTEVDSIDKRLIKQKGIT